ncbi:hypothetical protein CTI12_AA514160 [Artemisia annua]|uniref:Helitron helicase-like domain-containing protein n=1 Tax=Artemisia annua TaxID=35608 RepID=A0A2U1L9Y9_ARTAN|nr:hypothetical protein CTI12_AA514160 [Artemisia annua]
MSTLSGVGTSLGVNNNGNNRVDAGLVTLSCPVVSTSIQGNFCSSPFISHDAAASASVGVLSNTVPVQVQTVDGSVSTFQTVNMMHTFSVHAHQSTLSEAENLHFNAESAIRAPMVLDFSVGHMACDTSSGAAAVDSNTNPPTNRGTRGPPSSRHRIANGQSPIGNPNGVPMREHIAPAQREVQGLIDFLDHNNALVKLFRTARDKLRDANIPNFSIRLFGVVGANQYELPAGDSIGAIVYEGGPETMTDYDVVIEWHSREPEAVNKLHPRYMALQFPLLFVYGEEGYHLKLTLKNLVPGDQHEEKKMSMKNLHMHTYNAWLTAFIGMLYTRIIFTNALADQLFKKMSLTVERGAPSKDTTATVVSLRELAYLTELHPTDNSKFIQVRVYRKWTAMKVPSRVPTTFSCQLQLSATSATSYYFNPGVEETGDLLAAYKNTNTVAPQLVVQTERLTDWEQERSRNRVPLGTLLQIDPNTQQRVLFTQDATILRIDTGHEWYYQKCDECGGKLRYGYVHCQCHQYGKTPNPENRYTHFSKYNSRAILLANSQARDNEVEDKDPTNIPKALLALQNTRHVFQFRFAKPIPKGPTTFVLQKVMDNPPTALPEALAGPSSPPTLPIEHETDEHATPPHDACSNSRNSKRGANRHAYCASRTKQLKCKEGTIYGFCS